MASTQAYTLEIICPQCGVVHRYPHLDRQRRGFVALACLPEHGGCGGHAVLELPDLEGSPHLEVFITTGAMPITAAQFARIGAHPKADRHETPTPLARRWRGLART
jgi:hypothetical protein